MNRRLFRSIGAGLLLSGAASIGSQPADPLAALLGTSEFVVYADSAPIGADGFLSVAAVPIEDAALHGEYSADYLRSVRATRGHLLITRDFVVFAETAEGPVPHLIHRHGTTTDGHGRVLVARSDAVPDLPLLVLIDRCAGLCRWVSIHLIYPEYVDDGVIFAWQEDEDRYVVSWPPNLRDWDGGAARDGSRR